MLNEKRAFARAYTVAGRHYHRYPTQHNSFRSIHFDVGGGVIIIISGSIVVVVVVVIVVVLVVISIPLIRYITLCLNSIGVSLLLTLLLVRSHIRNRRTIRPRAFQGGPSRKMKKKTTAVLPMRQ